MTDLAQAMPIVAIVVLVSGLIYMQRRLSRLEGREHVRRKQQAVNAQMRRFSELTVRLLGGGETRAMAKEIAESVAATTTFTKVAVAFVDGAQMNVAGSTGMSEQQAGDFKAALAAMPLSRVQSLFEQSPQGDGGAERGGMTPILLSGDGSRELFGEQTASGDWCFVPVGSSKNVALGLIALQSAEGAPCSLDNLTGVQLLASNIALSIENTSAKKRTFQSEKLEGMGQLVAGVAHELNNPLTAVLGYTEILAEKTDDASMRYDLSVMRREALRMKRIIESLQQFSRKQRVEREQVNVAAVIHDTLQMRSDEIREQKIEVVKQVDPQLPSIVANQSLIDQVFQHVFANAMDAVHKAGLKRILIEARALGDQLHLQVSDSGPGFKDVGRVFDPFYTTKGPGKGTGLGLSLCYGIIRDHGGEITASNLHPLGACISIQLPLVSMEQRAQSPSSAAPVIR